MSDGELLADLDQRGRMKSLTLYLSPSVAQKCRPILQHSSTRLGTFALAPSDDSVEDILWIASRWEIAMSDSLRNWLRHRKAALEARRSAFAAITSCSAEDQLELPTQLALPLRPYQTQAVHAALASRGLLLADSVGLGKTAAAIGVLAAIGKGIVVCETHMPEQWKREIHRFWPSASVHIAKTGKPYHVTASVLILTYSKLVGWQDRVGEGSAIVFDEVQNLRHYDTQRYRAAYHMRSKCALALGLSATPIYNYGAESHSVLDALNPGCLGFRKSFLAEWCQDDTKGRVKDPQALGDHIRRNGWMLRRTREDVGRQLPPIQQITHALEWDSSVFDRLRREANELAFQALYGQFTEKGQAGRRLTSKLRQATGIAKAYRVAEFIAEIAATERVVVGVWHREVYTILIDQLALSGITCAVYSGEETPVQKERSIAEFKSGAARVLLLSLRSGVGLDGLQHLASTVIFAELDFSPAVMRQFVGRVDRDGQTKPVTVFYLTIEEGSDPPIAAILGEKDSQAINLVALGEDLAFAHSGREEDSAASALARAWLKRNQRHCA